MTIADKLTLLEQTKEAQRVKLGLPKNIPFSQYVKFIRDQFTPTDLFKNGEQGVWLDPSDLSTLFQDIEGTKPVTKDGDPVALMRDKSGNGNHATQTVSASRPVYKGLYYDGADDFMNMGINYPLGDFFISILVDTTNTKTNGVLLGNDDGTSGGAVILRINNADGRVEFYRGNVAGTLRGGDIRNTGMRVVTIACKGLVHSIHIDGVVISSVSLPAYTQQSKLTIGKWSTSTLTHKGAVHDVLVRTGAYSDADLSNANAYLKVKAGLTL